MCVGGGGGIEILIEMSFEWTYQPAAVHDVNVWPTKWPYQMW